MIKKPLKPRDLKNKIEWSSNLYSYIKLLVTVWSRPIKSNICQQFHTSEVFIVPDLAILITVTAYGNQKRA